MNSTLPAQPAAKSSVKGELQNWRTVPNLLTAVRMLLIFPFVHYAIGGQDLNALAVFAVAGITDAVDGALARWLHQTSRLGRLVDPVADKFLTAIAYVVLSLLRDGRTSIPTWLMVLVVSRDVLILIGCWVIWRFAQNTGFKPSVLGKLNTLLELLVIGWFLAVSSLPAVGRALPALYVITTISIGVSLVDYVRQGIGMIRQPTR